jgi:hypothetical protein
MYSTKGKNREMNLYRMKKGGLDESSPYMTWKEEP